MTQDWHCSSCGKLLGVLRETGRIHLKFARGHEYLVGCPATGVCRSCRALNELTAAGTSSDDSGERSN